MSQVLPETPRLGHRERLALLVVLELLVMPVLLVSPAIRVPSAPLASALLVHPVSRAMMAGLETLVPKVLLAKPAQRVHRLPRVLRVRTVLLVNLATQAKMGVQDLLELPVIPVILEPLAMTVLLGLPVNPAAQVAPFLAPMVRPDPMDLQDLLAHRRHKVPLVQMARMVLLETLFPERPVPVAPLVTLVNQETKAHMASQVPKDPLAHLEQDVQFALSDHQELTAKPDLLVLRVPMVTPVNKACLVTPAQ